MLEIVSVKDIIHNLIYYLHRPHAMVNVTGKIYTSTSFGKEKLG